MYDLIILVSGKRKSGKDYVCAILQRLIQEHTKLETTVIHLSAPLKKQYAIEHNLDYNLLLTPSEYKEKYRFDMVKWGEEVRSKDPTYFCKLALDSVPSSSQIVIVADCRRPSDLQYFKSIQCRVVTLRIHAQDTVRIQRGWKFEDAVDNGETECALDCSSLHDIIINNGCDNQILMDQLKQFVENTVIKISDNK